MELQSNNSSIVQTIQHALQLEEQGDMAAAIAIYSDWLKHNMTAEVAYAAHYNLAILYFKLDLTGLAQQSLRAALKLNPSLEQAKSVCIEPNLDLRMTMAARQKWGHDQLRVGWIGHSSAFANADIKRVTESFAQSSHKHQIYSWGPNKPHPNAIDVSTLEDEVVACDMRNNECDVLIDVSGWNTDSRPGIVAYHPAPIVAQWVKPFQPSGLQAVDITFTTAQVLSEIKHIQLFSEKILQLDNQYDSGLHLLEQIEKSLIAELEKLPLRLPLPSVQDAEISYIQQPENRGRRYVIVAPPYQHTSAGIRVLYDLQKWLVLAGYDALVCTLFQGYPIDSFVNDIIIYPEVVTGNPMNAKRIVRYILNRPGKIRGDKVYNCAEILFSYNHALAPYSDGRILEVPAFEPIFYDDPAFFRDKDVFYVGKGKNLGLHPKDCIEITRIHPAYPPTRQALADLLRSAKTLYTYDDFSAISREAYLCGCEVIVIDASGNMKPMTTHHQPTSVKEFKSQLHQFICITQSM